MRALASIRFKNPCVLLCVGSRMRTKILHPKNVFHHVDRTTVTATGPLQGHPAKNDCSTEVLLDFCTRVTFLRSVPGGPGNPSIPIRFYYRIRELNFQLPGLLGTLRKYVILLWDFIC
jgi:hypothetical protein